MLFCNSMTRSNAVRWLKAVTYIGIYGGLLLPVAFFPVVIFPFVFSKLLFFQVLIGLTFPAYLILALVEPEYRPKFVPLYAAITAYFCALLLSVVFAVDPGRAWWGNQERMNGLFTLLHFFAWLTMAVSLLKTWDQWKKILLYEVALSGFMAIVALLQKPFPRLLSFPAGARVGGLLDNPIYMGAYQIFNLFFILLLWLHGASRKTRLWLVLFAILDVGAFIAAQSRGALLGLAFGIVTFAVTFAIMTPHKKAKVSVLSAAVILFLTYGAIFAMRDTAFVKQTPLSRLTNFEVASRTRLIAWDIAWKGFLERPLTGWGLDDFHILFNEKYNPESLEHGYYETWFDRAHNTVMDALSMTGIFGTITFFSMFVALFYSVARAYRSRWIDDRMASIFYALPVAYFVQNLFVFDQPAGFTMSFFMYALIIRATTKGFASTAPADRTEDRNTTAAQKKNVPWLALGVLQALAILLVWRMSVLPARASYYTIQSNNYFSSGYFPQAFALAKIAAAIPTPYLDEQTFLQARNVISLLDSGKLQQFPQWREWHDLVLDLTKRHLTEHPRNTHPHFIFARFLDAFSTLIPEDGPHAEQEYLAALKSSPKRQQLYFNIGRFYIQHGRQKDGYEALKQAAELNPEVGEARWYVGISLFYDMDKKEDGARELAAAMKVRARYSLKNVREALTLAMAYEVLRDTEGFISVLEKLPALSGGDVPMFLEFARIAERLGLIPQRDIVLNAIVKADPSTRLRLAPLLETRTATTIEESLRQTENLKPAPVATSSAGSGTGSGPRVK